MRYLPVPLALLLLAIGGVFMYTIRRERRGGEELPPLPYDTSVVPSEVPSADPVPALEFMLHSLTAETLTPDDAADLAGKRRTYRVTTDSLPADVKDGITGFDCVSPPQADVTVYLRAGEPERAGTLIVAGVLHVVRHEPSGEHSAFTEYRIGDATVLEVVER